MNTQYLSGFSNSTSTEIKVVKNILNDIILPDITNIIISYIDKCDNCNEYSLNVCKCSHCKNENLYCYSFSNNNGCSVYTKDDKYCLCKNHKAEYDVGIYFSTPILFTISLGILSFPIIVGVSMLFRLIC
jgi:hypothetical protein